MASDRRWSLARRVLLAVAGGGRREHWARGSCVTAQPSPKALAPPPPPSAEAYPPTTPAHHRPHAVAPKPPPYHISRGASATQGTISQWPRAVPVLERMSTGRRPHPGLRRAWGGGGG